jgi:hypothetical protein
VRLHPGEPGEIVGHTCPACACQYEACDVRRMTEEMAELSTNEWYCPSHALIAIARELVVLVWHDKPTAIVTLVSEKLPDIVLKFTEDEGRIRCRRRSASP